MHESSTERFLALVELDQQLNQITREKNVLLLESQAISKSIDDAKAQLQIAYQKAHDSKKKLDALELELKSVDEARFKKRKQLENASDTKQFFSFEHELQSLEKQHKELEESVLNSWQDLEVAQIQYDKIKLDTPKHIDELQLDLNKLLSQINYSNARIEKALKDRPEFVSGIEPELIKDYTAMKEITPNPAAPVIRDACTACFNSLTGQDLRDLRSNKLIKCRSCGRFLYLPRPQESYIL